MSPVCMVSRVLPRKPKSTCCIAMGKGACRRRRAARSGRARESDSRPHPGISTDTARRTGAATSGGDQPALSSADRSELCQIHRLARHAAMYRTRALVRLSRAAEGEFGADPTHRRGHPTGPNARPIQPLNGRPVFSLFRYETAPCAVCGVLGWDRPGQTWRPLELARFKLLRIEHFKPCSR